MLNKIIQFSIKNKLIIALFVIAMSGYGVYQLQHLPIDAVPDITNNQVQVITVAPSFGATDIERLVTFPIEQANNNIPGLIEIRSFSRFGLSLVTIVFEDETDIYWARQQVAERLQKVRNEIPAGIGVPELGPVTTGLGEIYQYVVRPAAGYEKRYSVTELRTIQDWIVRRQLLGVKGVAEVSSFGGKLKQYEVAVDPRKLQSYGLTIGDLFNAINNNNANTGGAYIEKGSTVLNIRTEGLIGSMEDISNVAVRQNANGSPLLVRDVATVREGSATRFGALAYNDKGEVSGAVVMMLKGANSSDVINDVKLRISEIQRTLPEGVVIEPFLDRTKMVNNAITTVETNLMEGALIVIFVLVLFLGNLRAGLIVASVIPLSMLFAVIMMNLFGVSGNLMSLGALDFGLIVDGAVIIVEAVMHRLSISKKYAGVTKLGKEQMDGEVAYSAGKMMNSAVFGQLIILVVYLPIFTLQGIEGKMFKPMAQTVAFALAGAFILSLTYIPMMSALLLSRKLQHKKNISDRLMERLEKIFRSALEKVIRFPRMALSVVLGFFAVALSVLSTLGGEFIPALEEGDFAVETRLLTGSSISASLDNAAKAAGILKSRFPEVEKVVTKIGSGEVPTDPMPMEAADLMVILKDKKQWTSAATFNDLAEKMGDALSEIPGVTYSFQYPVQMRFNELMTGAKQDVVCKIFGEDLDTLARYASRLGAVISAIEGARDLYIETVTGIPQIVISYKRANMAQYGVSVGAVNDVVNTAFAGRICGTVFEGERRFDLVLRLDSAGRKDLRNVMNLPVPLPNGTQVPLSHLALVEIKDGPNQIQREDARRRIIVGFNVRGRDVQSIVNELRTKVEEQIVFPVGYYPVYGGAFENLNAAKKRLAVAVPVSLLLIFILLYFAFHSVRQGLLIYSAIPLSAIGGIFALFMRQMPFSISAGIGFIALFGVAVLNGIVLISEFNRLRAEGMNNLRDVVLEGTRARLRPVLMTAAVASLGFLPMALSNGSGAEVQRPLATVVIGGLIIATALTLFILPVLYMLFEKRSLIKGKPLAGAVILFLMMFFPSVINSQNTISIDAAVDTALKNNLRIRNQRLLLEYRQRLINTGNDVQPALVSLEYGQINSVYKDNRFGITQSFSFPSVYARQKSALRAAAGEEQFQVALGEAGLKKEVSSVYSELQIMRIRKKLLLKNDSMYAAFLSRASLRLEKGESNIIEQITAETRRAEISFQLRRLETDLETMKLKFMILLNSHAAYEPDILELKMQPFLNADTAMLKQHPAVRLLIQSSQLSEDQLQLEKARFLPGFFVSYNNMSMRGTGADNVMYSGSARFQSAQIGLGLPLFFGAQKARISAARSGRAIAANSLNEGIRLIQSQYSQALAAYRAASANLFYFEEKGLSNARVLFEAASRQYTNGEINYLEWVLLNNQAVMLENEYLNALKDFNDAVILLNYLSVK